VSTTKHQRNSTDNPGDFQLMMEAGYNFYQRPVIFDELNKDLSFVNRSMMVNNERPVIKINGDTIGDIDDISTKQEFILKPQKMQSLSKRLVSNDT
jgi:hypothetical protein